MRIKVRNWLLGGLGIATFILGVPLLQHVFASSDAAAARAEKEHVASSMTGSESTHPQVISVGDEYLRIVPMSNGSVSAELYDSSFRLLAVNENEAALTFLLPNGEKKTVRITVPVMGCSAKEGSSGKADCCAGGAEEASHENCPHQGKDRARISENYSAGLGSGSEFASKVNAARSTVASSNALPAS
ncbi:MAG: hypothetical protein JSV16_04370 [Candidatus Hydrogenedentota bacterium]|nr:MAG: hypothetical protein JSV16_04370 [Candidatus Hydrogenedentota bacterium]